VPIPPPFSTRVLDEGADPVVVEVVGEVDVATSPQLERRLLDLVAGGKLDIVLDLSEVTFLDSSGIGALVRVWRPLKTAGGSLTIRHPSPLVRRVLSIEGMDQVWSIE
jgi:anti-sigma B factor antagonist